MRPGQRTSSLPGSLEECVLDFSFAALPGGGSGVLSFRPASGYGGRVFGIYLNGRRLSHTSVSEGQAARIPLVVSSASATEPEGGDVSIFLEDFGDWPDATYDPDDGALSFEQVGAQRLNLNWTASVEIVPRGGSSVLSQLSSWSLSGIKRFSNCVPLSGHPTRALLSPVLTVAGAQRTVSLYAGSMLVAQGIRTGDGVLTLQAVNQSGLTGSVTVTAGSGVASGDLSLEVRFPQSYQIHYDTAALSFPRTAQTLVFDDGRSNRFHALSNILATGTYHTAIASVSDSGVENTPVASQTVELGGPPNPPSSVLYASGNAAATVISFVASSTSGATYNVYASQINEPINLQTPVGTHAAGTGTLTQTLPAISGTPGLRRVLIRAVNSGVEEQNANILQLEYDVAGNVIGARPNVPRLKNISVASGRQLTIQAVYTTAYQAVAATQAQLFIAPENSAMDYSSPLDTQSWSDEVGGVRVATLTATAPSDGFYKVAVRAISAAGVQDSGTANERIHVSTVAPPEVASVNAMASRG